MRGPGACATYGGTARASAPARASATVHAPLLRHAPLPGTQSGNTACASAPARAYAMAVRRLSVRCSMRPLAVLSAPSGGAQCAL